jgi:hypothetical protein
LADGYPGPSRLSGSAIHGGKPTGIAKGTTPLSSNPNQEAVQASLAYGLATAVKPHSHSSINKKYKQKNPNKKKKKKKKSLFSRSKMEESKMKRDSGNKPENSDTETDEETLRDLDKKKISKTFVEIAAELIQQQGHIPMQQQGYTPADLEMPALNKDPDLPPLPMNKDQYPPGIGNSCHGNCT